MKIKLNQKDIIDYMHTCFTKVDGLWFLKMEENFGFDAALVLDKKVWEVIPKIQARFIKEKLLAKYEQYKSASIEELFIPALRIKLTLDRFDFTIKQKSGSAAVKIKKCPWHDIMVKSGRENLSSKIGSHICFTEYKFFVREFYPEAKIEFKERICCSKSFCDLIFYFKKDYMSFEK